MTIEQILSLVKPYLKTLAPYSSARDEFHGVASVFLDANENPFPSGYNRYPDPHQKDVKQALARLKNVNAENIFVGNGSDEAINLLIRLFCEEGKHAILIPSPTYGMYSVSAASHNIATNVVPLDEQFDLAIEKIEASMDGNTRLIFICSPNNPSGNTVSREKIVSVLKMFSGIVVVDEAYIDFCAEESILPLLEQYPNLVVLQTLSKAWGMAGLRVGMAFAHVELIRLLNKIKPPYNISAFTQEETLRRLQRQDEMKKAVSEILVQRKQLTQELASLPSVVSIYPSKANFILVKTTNAKKIYEHLLQQGIVVRDRSSVAGCENCLRVTIGTEQENKKVVEVWKKINV